MPWCPKCNTEYVEGYDICSDYNIPLVNEQPDSNENLQRDSVKEAYLVSGYDEYWVIMIKNILESDGIPVLVKDQGSGSYLTIYMGKSFYGKDIYVPSDRLEEAKILIQGFLGEFVEEDIEDVKEDKPVKAKKIVFRWWIILLFLVPPMLILSYSLFRALTY